MGEEGGEGELGVWGKVLDCLLKSAFTTEGFIVKVRIYLIQCPILETFKPRGQGLT